MNALLPRDLLAVAVSLAMVAPSLPPRMARGVRILAGVVVIVACGLWMAGTPLLPTH